MPETLHRPFNDRFRERPVAWHPRGSTGGYGPASRDSTDGGTQPGLLILAVLGSILFGLATPTEATSIGALGGMVPAVAHRVMTFQHLRESVYLTVRTTATVCWLFVGSYSFPAVFSYLGGEAVIADFVKGLDLTPAQFLLIVQLIIFLPLLPIFGIDSLFFGVLVALHLQTSFLTPPMAMSALPFPRDRFRTAACDPWRKMIPKPA